MVPLSPIMTFPLFPFNVISDCLVGAVVPAALPIAGAVIVVGIGLRVFKKVTGR